MTMYFWKILYSLEAVATHQEELWKKVFGDEKNFSFILTKIQK